MRVSTDHHNICLNSLCSHKPSLNRGSPRSQFTQLRAHLRDPDMGMQPLTTDQLSQYFLRVRLKKNLETLQPDLHLLCQMHLAHVQQIAYENLSLHLDKAREQHPKVSLQTEYLVQKLVQSRRGGYCFEQNLLFAAALRACGFAIYMLSARVTKPGPDEPSKTLIVHNQPHIAIGVVISGTHWVADVGYGGKGLRLPVKNDLIHASNSSCPIVVAESDESLFSKSTLDVDAYDAAKDVWQASTGQCSGYGHRLRSKEFSELLSDDAALQMQKPAFFVQALDSKGEFQDQYVFQCQATDFAEFDMLNWYTSTCPAANHLKNVIVARQTPLGRNTYNGKEFKIFEGSTCTMVKQPETQQEQYFYLQQLFELRFEQV